MTFFSIFKVTENPTPARHSSMLHGLPPRPQTDCNSYLLAAVAAVLALEFLLVPVSFLVLKEAIAVVEDSRTVAALHRCGSVSVQVAHMDTYNRDRTRYMGGCYFLRGHSKPGFLTQHC